MVSDAPFEMARDAPFDVWDGEELGTQDFVAEEAAEEIAMHVEEEPVSAPGPHWSELTDEVSDDDRPVTYFEDEQPEQASSEPIGPDDHEVGLEEILERQHYAFRSS